MQIEQVWPEWHEDCVLGEGSFGKVYRARRVEYGRTFYSAIKVLKVPKSTQEVKAARAQGMNDEEIRAYFRSMVDGLLNEITLMDNLKGAKNIVTIDDYKIMERPGEIGWEIFIRMELLTPFDSFASKPDYTQGDVIRLGVDLCSALEICEQNQIIHRDIKPDNVFISRFGEYKLGDFGIARKLEASMANLSRKGTLNYMAPEVYRGEEYGSSVDIYSLGLMLYMLLNKNRMAFLPPWPQPIAYKDNESAFSRRLSGEALPLPDGATESLGRVVVKACAFRPQERYQTAAQFREALLNEWNRMAQMGTDRPVNAQPAQPAQSDANGTVRDMTVHGKPVSSRQAAPVRPVQQAQVLPRAESNAFCALAAYPAALAGIVLAGGMLAAQNAPAAAWCGVCGCAAILAGGRGKIAIGLSAAGMGVWGLVSSIAVLMGGLQQSIPVAAILQALSALLLICAGIVFAVQREIRLGSAAVLYSILITAGMEIYQRAAEHESGSGAQITLCVVLAALMLWGYGYDSSDESWGVRKILGYAAMVPAAAALGYTLLKIVSVL